MLTLAYSQVRYSERTMRFLTSLLGIALFAAQAHAQTKETSMHHAHGTFTVDVRPAQPDLPEGLKRYSLDKQIHGDLEATGKGEMLAGGDPRQGAAGYVAMELVTGTLGGKHGSFALQHSATISADGQKMTIIVVPGSGTGDLKGIAGTFTIRIEDKQHFYDFDYEMPE